MLAITRFRADDPDGFLDLARQVLTELSQCSGLLDAQVVRAIDDPEVFALVSRWEGAGDYRRALGRVPVRMVLLPLAMSAVDEPGAFEEVLQVEPGEPVRNLPRAGADGPWTTAREEEDGDWID